MIHNAACTPRWAGSDFDGMLETFLGPAHFDGSPAHGPAHGVEGFSWSADARSHGAVTVADLECKGEWNLLATAETPDWLTIYVPREGLSGMTRRQITTIASPGQILLGHSREADHFLARGALHRSQKLFLDWGRISHTFGQLFEAPLSGSLDLSPLVDGSTPSGHLIKESCRDDHLRHARRRHLASFADSDDQPHPGSRRFADQIGAPSLLSATGTDRVHACSTARSPGHRFHARKYCRADHNPDDRSIRQRLSSLLGDRLPDFQRGDTGQLPQNSKITRRQKRPSGSVELAEHQGHLSEMGFRPRRPLFCTLRVGLRGKSSGNPPAEI